MIFKSPEGDNSALRYRIPFNPEGLSGLQCTVAVSKNLALRNLACQTKIRFQTFARLFSNLYFDKLTKINSFLSFPEPHSFLHYLLQFCMSLCLPDTVFPCGESPRATLCFPSVISLLPSLISNCGSPLPAMGLGSFEFIVCFSTREF